MDESTRALSKLSLLTLLEIGGLPFVVLLVRWEFALLAFAAFVAALLHPRVQSALRFRPYLTYLICMAALAAISSVLAYIQPRHAGLVAIFAGAGALVLMLRASKLMKSQFGYTA